MSRSVSRSGNTPLPPRPAPITVNTQTKVFNSAAGRILCIADVRGRIATINELVEETKADAVIHTGDFGFFENSSLERINDRTLRHLIQYSPLVSGEQRASLSSPEVSLASIRNAIATSSTPILSEFPLLLSGDIKLSVPVYTVWGACEDVAVLEKFRTGQYEIHNFNVIDEVTTRCLDIGGIKLRLLGLGGAVVPHKLFDNGEGHATMAGGSGTMWTTALQIGELVDTAQRVFHPTETRVLITHASPGRDGLLAQLALILKIDLTISASLHFRYASSYNEFSVQPDLEGFRRKLLTGKEVFDRVWDNVKPQVEAVVDPGQRLLLDKMLAVVERIPSSVGPATGPTSGEDSVWKNCWNWNLCDAANGSLVLDIRNGRVSSELKSQGFNYSYRKTATPSTTAPTPQSATSALPQQPQTKTSTPAPYGLSPAQNATPVSAEVTSSSPINPPSSQPESVNGSKPNGVAAFDAGGFEIARDRQQAKKQQKKDRERERKKEEKETPDKKDLLKSHQPKPSTSSSTPSGDAEPISPAEGTGARTPTGPPRRQRNPWTLFMKLPVPVTENELREFFQDAKEGITNIKIPQSTFTRSRVAFIEFGDEEAMKAGLNGHAEKLKDQPVHVTIADDRERDRPSERGGFGGRGRGRGGFAQRAAAQAGLFGRNMGGSRRNEGGENASKPAEPSS